jgi:hypothetical protein
MTWMNSLRGPTRYGALAAALLGTVALSQCDPIATDPGDVEVHPPVATLTVVGEATGIEVGVVVQLDGRESVLGESSPDGAELVYFWNLDTKPLNSALVDESITVAGEDEPGLVQIVPDAQGIYGVTLQVGDGELLSDLAHVIIDVGGGNTCPAADAGPDLIGATGIPVTLDGSNTEDPDIEPQSGDDDDSAGDDDDSAADPEPEGQVLDFEWRFSLVPSESALTSSDIFYQGTDHPVFIPDVAGSYIMQLRADDGLCTSEPDYVQVQVSNGNQTPVADAGNSIILTPCSPTEIALDGTASYDPEGQPLGYAWRFTSVPNGSDVSDAFLEDRFSATPRFNADVPGFYTLELLVEDSESESEPDYVGVQVVPSQPNEVPISNAGEDVIVEATAHCSNDPYGPSSCNPCGSRPAVLDGSGSFDPDNDALNYQWDMQTAGDATLLGVESQTVEVTLPEVSVTAGNPVTLTFDVSLTVFDCRGADDDLVTVTYICTPNL